tara:strand:+ start:129 stop:1520 length:1392 start_codon:yes stop_codon:yes gene_type:complete
MSTIEKFEKAKAYEQVYYPSSGDVTALDFWYENIFYGRIDREANAICFKDTQLKQVPSKQGTIFAANFVVDAYKDLRNYCKKAAAHGKIQSGGVYGTLEALGGWRSASSLYHSHMETLMQSFAFYFGVGKRSESILSFKDFVKQFLDFAASVSPRVPITKTSFILSRYCPPHVSGLVIELDNKGTLKGDLDKKQKFINDPNFLFFRKAAKKFGFYIDKNAPWTLVANIFSSGQFESPPFPSQTNFEPQTIKTGMASYLEEYGLTPDEVFDTLYFKVFEGDPWRDGANGDIDLLRYYLLQFYNTLLAAEPHVYKSFVCVGSKQVKTKKMKFTRQKIGQIEANGDLPYLYKKKFGDKFWLRTFLNIRMLEQSLSHGFNDMFLESKYILEKEGFLPALDFINTKTNGFRRTIFNRKGSFWQGYSPEEKNLLFLNQTTSSPAPLPSLPSAEVFTSPNTNITGGSSGY